MAVNVNIYNGIFYQILIFTHHYNKHLLFCWGVAESSPACNIDINIYLIAQDVLASEECDQDFIGQWDTKLRCEVKPKWMTFQKKFCR